jgi:hypothetical protein
LAINIPTPGAGGPIIVISDGRAMDHGVLHALREAVTVDGSLGNGDSSTMEGLRYGQVKLGVARHEHYAGSPRRMVNHIRTGTMSRHTLLNVLERRSEHLLASLVRKVEDRSTSC